MTEYYDIVGIGDTVIDAFIRIDAGEIETHSGNTEYCLPFGSKIPYEDVTVVHAVGNSANGVVSAARLGLKTALVTFFGNDAHGLECINKLKKEGVSMDFASQEDGKKTNYHYVLWHGPERTILVKHEAFASHLPNIGEPGWIYLSSLGSHTKELHEELMGYLEAHPSIKLSFQPGTFQIEMGKEILSRLYARTEVFCANKEEYMQILGTEETDIKKLIDMMQATGPKILVLTDGPNGSYMKVNGSYYQMPLYPDIAPPLDRTGAGDAFCSTFISYLAKGLTPEEAIARAPINSMSVVQKIGAQEGLLSEEKIESYLKNAPEEYTLKTI